MLDWIVGSGMLGLMGLILANNRSYDSKVSRVYERLDEVKKENNTQYTNKDVCSVRHEQLTLDLKEIKTSIKEIDRFLRNGKHDSNK